MRLINLGRVAAVLAFGLCTAGAVDTAQAAGITVFVDCQGAGGNPTWAPTNSTITIKAKINGTWTTMQGYQPTVPAWLCTAGNSIQAWLTSWSLAETQALRISISGDDAFWVDKVWLYDSDTLALVTWGNEDNSGWCHSTDPSDGNNSFCIGASAFTSWTFPK